MAHVVMTYIVMTYIVMAYIAMTHVVMAYIAMAHVVMAYIVMGYIAMAYVVMAIATARSSPTYGLTLMSYKYLICPIISCVTATSMFGLSGDLAQL